MPNSQCPDVTMLQNFLTRKRGFIWPLRLGCDAGEMPALAALPVDESAVLRDPVVPDDHCARLPPDPRLEVGTVC